MGSSPRGRGKPAGGTVLHGRAHPRVGGENRRLGGRRRRYQGSSPRGRGKLAGTGALTEDLGLIPAWAGKTDWGQGHLAGCKAHPRVGGENRYQCFREYPFLGSSPRGRGKQRWFHSPALGPGLIPAWAGKTRRGGLHLRGAGAHPRVGGENSERAMYSPSLGGSSPRGRGKQYVVAFWRWACGLIPAWAGKTGS